MSDARVSDGYLSSGETIKLLELLYKAPEIARIERVVDNMGALYHAPRARTANTVRVLVEFGILLEIESGIKLACTQSASSEEFSRLLSAATASELVRRIEDSNNWYCIRFEQRPNRLVLNSMLLPPMSDGLGHWIIGFGVASRKSLAERKWVISEEHRKIFEAKIAELNRRGTPRAKSAEDFKRQMAKQAELGAMAEDWVVNFEKRRLENHPLKEQVRRISEDDVGAGFDILSFSDEHSLRHNRFIEVKSYSSEKRFYWTRNEVETAREIGSAYCIYLVDRQKMHLENYLPQIIEGPTPELFQIDGSGWSVRSSELELRVKR